MGKVPDKKKKESKVKTKEKKRSSPEGLKPAKKVINYISIIIGLFLLLIAFTVLSVVALFKYDLVEVVDLNMGKVEASEIVYETYTYNIDERADPSLAEMIDSTLEQIAFHDIQRFEKVAEAEKSPNFLIKTESDPEKCTNSLAKYELLPVGHFYWVKDELKVTELELAKFITISDYEESANSILVSIANENPLKIVDSIAELIIELKKGESHIGLVDHKDLTPELKLLSYQGKYYLEDLPLGSLQSCLYVESYVSNSKSIQAILDKNLLHMLNTNGEDRSVGMSDDNIISVRMTGVTAMSRNLAIKIEQSGNNAYPSAKIGEFLASADYTHTSNEVSFVEGCTPQQSMSFCSAPKYIDALTASGIDIVELTGNHNNDYGADDNKTTIETYDSLGWDHFGGGYDIDDASKILYIEDSGSTIAFLGYNYFDTMLNSGAIASEDRAGANSYSSTKLEANIKEAKANADVVIVDFQFQECFSYPEDGGIYPICYRPLTVPDQKGVFREAIDLGADIVVGTQAHQPQTYEIYEDGIIFYGLGNLYFDQIPWIGTRQGLILTHYFVDGEYLQTKIDTTIYNSDMQPYVTYGADRELLLDLLYQAR